MNTKILALSTSILWAIPQWISAQETYILWEKVSGIHIARMPSDCYINTTANNTIVHCQNESTIQVFMALNGLDNIRYSPSILQIQWESLLRVLDIFWNSSQKVWGILEMTPPYNFRVYPNKLRVCLEMNAPWIPNTLGWVFIDTNGDDQYNALISGECTWMNGNDEFNIDGLSLFYPGYSITLPETSYDCVVSGNIYNCRTWVDFPFQSLRSHITRDVIQIQYPWATDEELPRIDISYTYVLEQESL